MKTRKELKDKAKLNVKRHYGLFLLICLISVVLSSEFLGSGFYMKGTDTILHPELAVVDKYVNKVPENTLQKVFGRQDGVFSNILNVVQSGQIYIKVIDAVANIVNSRNVGISILIGLSLYFFIVFWYYIENVYKVISRRFFLEGRTYKKLPFQRFIYLRKIKRWRKVARCMFRVFIYKVLWSLIIVGGIIKRYSYFLVPYILAENPNIEPKDAISLSRRMMKGYKWEAFKLEFSFILWKILGILTLGVSNVLILNPYKVATYTEFYVEVRRISKNMKVNGVELLNDTYLYEKASTETIKEAYEEILEDISKKDNIELPNGFRGMLARVFGITTFSSDFNERYEKESIRKQKERIYNAVINKEEYPLRLFITKIIEKKDKRFERYNYLRMYSLSSLVLIFFTIAFVGWFWEVCIHLVEDGRFVNRGMLQGPWLPIYGAGCTIILVMLYNVRRNPMKHFAYTILICGVVEYWTSFVMDIVFDGVKWWDYTGYFFNLNGRICAEGLTLFGVGGMAVAYFVAPYIDNIIRRINKKLAVIAAVILVIIFSMDLVFSIKNPNTGAGITDYAQSATQLNIEEIN